MTNGKGGFVRATISGITVYSSYIPPRYGIDDFKEIIGAITFAL